MVKAGETYGKAEALCSGLRSLFRRRP